MGRPAGHRNADFVDKRDELVDRVRHAMMRAGAGLSFRELAEAAGTSVSNLRHYFGDRDALVAAVAERASRDGAPYMAAASIPGAGSVEEILTRFLLNTVFAWRHFGVDRVHTVTLTEGLGSDVRGAAYVNHVLEPTLQTAERLLAALVERGDLPALDVRGAALALVGPVLLALLHQDGLNGRACRPLDVEAFARGHVRAWLGGYG